MIERGGISLRSDERCNPVGSFYVVELTVSLPYLVITPLCCGANLHGLVLNFLSKRGDTL